MSDSPARYLLYARQSLSRTPEDSLSIEFQLAECAAYVAKQGGVVAGTYSDPDTKGWRRNRPGFDAMLAAIRPGDTILLYKMSRFARNLMMQEEVVAAIADAGGELVSITEPHITTSPMIRQILGAVNENYRRDQSDWLRSTFAARARKGLTNGHAPYGYQLADGVLVPGDDADRVRQMWEWALAGHGSPEIAYRATARGWTTRNGKPWYQTAVLRLLRNPVYAGHVRHRGEVVARDAHPAIITDAEYEQVQDIIARRFDHRRKVAPSWAEGFVWHACGRRMYLSGWHDGGEPRGRFRCQGVWVSSRDNGRCGHRPATVFASKVEAGMVAAVLDLAGRFADVEAVAAAVGSRGSDDRERQRSRLERRLADLGHQRQRLLDLVLRGTIDPDLYSDRDDALKAELAAVRDDLAATPPDISPAAIRGQHAALGSLLDAVRVIADTDPARLVPVLSALGARYVLGDGDGRLEIDEGLRPYFTGY